MSRLHAHVCVRAGTHTVRMCYAIREAIESLTACTSFIVASIQLTIFPANKGATRRIWGIVRLPKSCLQCVCARADILCTCAKSRGQKRTRQSRIPIAVSLRSVLRRHDAYIDKGAGNSLFVPRTMNVYRRLGLILNETSLRLFTRV